MDIVEKDAFFAALAITDAAEREGYLQAACAGNPDMLGRLRELLAAHEESQGPLDRSPMALGVTVYLPEKDRLSATKEYLLGNIAMSMGGRIAEDIFIGSIHFANGYFHRGLHIFFANPAYFGRHGCTE